MARHILIVSLALAHVSCIMDSVFGTTFVILVVTNFFKKYNTDADTQKYAPL